VADVGNGLVSLYRNKYVVLCSCPILYLEFGELPLKGSVRPEPIGGLPLQATLYDALEIRRQSRPHPVDGRRFGFENLRDRCSCRLSLKRTLPRNHFIQHRSALADFFKPYFLY
jgi:hypothetical protein